jgi:predicted dehydrogenase
MASLRTAVLGYGLAGRVFHCPFLSAVPGLELTAIVQRHGDEASRAYPAATILRSPEEAFADPNIDLIVVATPNETHTELATAALRAGKHVVVDKPLAPTSAEARTLINLATEQGRVLAPFHNRRYDGDFLTLKKLLAAETLGRPVSITSRFDRFRPLPRPNAWKETNGLKNGILFDLGPHLVDQALALFGVPDRITASDREERDVTAIDDAFHLTLHYENHAGSGRALLYHCAATFLAADPSPRYAAHGTNGSYIKYGVDQQEPTLIKALATVPPLGSPEPWFNDPETLYGTLTTCTKPTEPVELDAKKLPTEAGDYRLFYANVRDAISGAAPLAIPAEDAFRTLRLLELAVQSSNERRTLDVSF